MEFDEEFVILLRREQRGDSVSGLVPMFLSVAGSRRLMGLIRLKYVPDNRDRTGDLWIAPNRLTCDVRRFHSERKASSRCRQRAVRGDPHRAACGLVCVCYETNALTN